MLVATAKRVNSQSVVGVHQLLEDPNKVVKLLGIFPFLVSPNMEFN